MTAVVLEARPEPIPCDHAEAEILGSEGSATFLRCRACDRVLIVQAGRVWMMRPCTGPRGRPV